MTTQNTQLGVKAESTFGTPVTVDRFYEFNKWDVRLQRGAVMSKGLRVGRRVQRADRFMPYTQGAAGSFEMDVPTKGFGLLLTHMLGSTSVGTVTDSNYTQTHTIGTLLGKSLTMQVGRPRVGSATIDPYTYHGCKFTGWELAVDVEGLLVAKFDVDAEDCDTSTSLATASYATSYNVFTFDGCAITIGGSSYEATSFGLKCDSNLKTDRRYLTGSPLKKEQLENGERSFEVSIEGDYVNRTQYDRFAAATAAGQLAAVTATFTGPVAHGGTTLPQLVVTLPAVRFADDNNPIEGPETITESITGEVVDNATDQPVTITYRTTDAAAA